MAKRRGTSGLGWWALAGLLVGLAGLGASQLVAELFSVRETPLESAFDAVAGLTPGSFAQATAEFLATLVEPTLVLLMATLMGLAFVAGGALWRGARWAALVVWGLLALGDAALGVALQGWGITQVLPGVTALVVWAGLMALLDPSLRRYEREAEQAEAGVATGGRPARRSVLRLFAAVCAAALAGGGAARALERRRSAVDESRKLLRIPGATRPRVPGQALVDVEGVTPWQTPNREFRVASTGLRTPTVEASSWRLRIHGLVTTPLEISYDDLLDLGLVESWATVASVRDEVGGASLGNAWWSGVPTRALLERAGVWKTADAVRQVSADGWSCATPLQALTDERPAMLAVAMNGEALPLEHGFPVRTLVPGLYTETGDCRWVVEWEVTRFADVRAQEDAPAWSRRAPVRLGSRIDVPASGSRVEAGTVALAGVAWQPGVGVSRVQYSLDGGPWRDALVAQPGTPETWAQWRAEARLAPGDHDLRVRAVNRFGEVQTSVERDPLPNGVTGWHTVAFRAEAPDGQD